MNVMQGANQFIDVDHLRKLMKEEEIDVLIALSPENVLYSSGANIITQTMLRERLALTVFTQTEEPTLIVCSIEESLVREDSWIKDVRTYTEFKESPIETLVNVLNEKGLKNPMIAIEKKYLSLHFYEELVERLNHTQFYPSEIIFDRLRAIKNPVEIDILRYAATVTREAMDEVFSNVKHGDTEKQVANRLTNALFEKGADEHAFIVLSTGKRSKIIHPDPQDIPIEAGDVIKVDFGGKFNGYYSDVARTYIVGESTERKRYVLSSLAEIHQELIKSAKVGVRFADLYYLCKERFQEKGLAFTMPHIGHSMGIALHEEPIISPLNQSVLEENMILNIEPICIDEESDSGYHLEDLVLITKDGPEVLTGSSLTEHPIIVGE